MSTYDEDDYMEIGDSGWIPVGEGLFKNIKTGKIIDETGIEYDSFGNIVEQENK
jgi:hypothetical protein